MATASLSSGNREPFTFAGHQFFSENETLNSTQHLTIVDVLSEGEIEGFPSAVGYTKGTTTYNNAALKDVYLTGTPVLRSTANPANLQDTDFNFRNIAFEPRFGTANQTFIPGIAEIESEYNVGVTVEQATPISRTITNTNVDAVRVTVQFPSIQKFTDEGDIDGTTIDLKVEIIQNNGTVTTPITDKVIGRSNNAYSRDYRINLNSSIVFPITVRVTRITADSTDSKLQNAFSWTSYTEIIDEQRPYPNIAHAGLRFDSEQFPSVPARMYKLRGIKIPIPSNGTVQSDGSITYTGTWNGTFKATNEWCSDPAWLLHELLINSRWGLGDHVKAAHIDKFAFYSASQYCSEQVDDGSGTGSTEPRFSCNALIQQRSDAFKVINELCSVMRTMPYWTAGSLTINQDSPKTSSYLFTLSNVSKDGFNYSGSSLKTRSTSVSVGYFDMTNQEKDYETVTDSVAEAKYGVIHKQIEAFGCTSRNQAARMGRWLLYEEQNATETVSFTTSIDAGVLVRPGQVIEIADPLKAGLRRGGRINSATTTTVTVDNTDATDLDSTNNPTLSVVLPDGSVETKNVSNISGAVITVDSAFSSAPNANSVWILQNDTVQTTQWRVVHVKEDKTTYGITALSYNPGKFAYVEDGTALPVRNVSILNAILDAPESLNAVERFYEEKQQAKTKIIFSWGSVKGASQYEVHFRKGENNYERTRVSSTELEILDTTAGVYDFRIVSLNALFEPSATPATLEFNAVGKTAVPAAPTNLSFETINQNSGRLRWDITTELDVKLGGKVNIKHSSLTDGSGTWNNSVELIPAKSGVQTEAIIPMVAGEVLVAFEDSGGRISSATSVIIDPPDPIGRLPVLVRREDTDSPPFQGVKTDCFYSDEYDALVIDGGNSFDAITDVDAIANFDFFGDVKPLATYNFINSVDLGNAFALDLERRFVTRGFLPSDLIDNRSALCDTWADWDGGIINNVNAVLELRSTNDDPASGSATWSAWQPFINGTFKGRGYQFRTKLTSTDVDENILVDELGFTASMQKRSESSNGTIASGAATKTVTFDKAFFTGTAALGGATAYLPSVGITAMNMASGDYFEVGTITGSSFQVTFKQANGTIINRNFLYNAVGYGKGL